MATSLRNRALSIATLLPFAAVALFGLFTLLGWWGGQPTWVQPRTYDLPLPANAALGLLGLGLAAIAIRLERPRIGALLAGLTGTFLAVILLESASGADLGLENLLVNHRELVDGTHVGRLPAALAAVLTLTGLLLSWLGLHRPQSHQPLLFALVGSLACAYGLTALLASRIGLDHVAVWETHAHAGPSTAMALLVLGAGLILLATQESYDNFAMGLRWVWLPVVSTGATVSMLFWISLREREVAYLNSTTQLTINNIATLYSNETETHINTLTRMATRWADSGGVTRESWMRDARALSQNDEVYRTLSWVDNDARTRWLWPQEGNEEALAFNHSSHPLRKLAMGSARETLTFALAAPLISPVQPPSFAIYATVLRDGHLDGFVVGELGYQQMLSIIDRRLNISQRYEMRAEVWDSLTAPSRSVPVYQSATPGEKVEAKLTQSATFKFFNDRLTLTLTPRPEFIAPNRQYLPELTLLFGLGVSLLLGLVVNLAQTALSRQSAAESTSAALRAENEERRRIEARLKVTDERLNLALDSTQVGVYEWDVPSGNTHYSPSVWTSLGYDPTQMPATWQTLLDRIHSDDRSSFQSAITAHFRGDTPFIEPEFRVRHQNGDWHWFSARAKCVAWDRNGKPRRVTGTCQNITERRRAEEALRTSLAATRKLSHVASRTDNAVAITKADGTVEWVNESFIRLSEQTLAEVIGRPFIELIASPDSDPLAVARIASALAHVEAITTDVMHHAPSGRHYYVRLEVQPLVNTDGQAENFIIIEADITSRVEVEQQLRRAKSEADAASRAKSEFLASMSHEIRTPMNGVIGMTSLLLETPLTEEQRDYVQTIRTSGDALLSIINEILDFSKIESGKMELENRPFEVEQCVEEALDIFALQAAAKNIELAYAIDPTVPRWISGDITRLRQVLVNLLNNAVKFTARGFITIEIRPALATDTPPADRQLIDFVITDTGIGIPADRLNLLFKPFSQVDSSTTRKYGGTGLGLAICDRLCQLMGGTIDVSSQPGHGSRFRFSILAETVPAPVGSTTGYNFGGVQALAVDDHPVNRLALQHCLTAAGFSPRLASTADEALPLLRDSRVHIAIVDHDLAGHSGSELVTKLRQQRPRLPVIFLAAASEGVRSGQNSDPTLIRLPKPIKPAILLDAIARVLKVGEAEPVAPTDEAIAAASLAEQLPLAVLLVEDNPVNQKVALRFLERLGYAADAVTNGLDAVRSCQKTPYDIVFMDIQMPEMDGLTATREIRARLAPDHQPKIVALTANAVQGDRERCLAAGMDDYLSKPVKIEALEQVIVKFFRPAPNT